MQPLSATEVRVLSRLLERMLKLPPAEREAWLEALPEAQQVLVPRLRERLAQIDQPAADATPPRPQPVRKSDSRAGERVGPYRLVQPLSGEPATAVLWEAEHGEGATRQAVALMLPADAGAAERQLASLPEHPHVRRLQDAGIAGGRPYRVMAWVDGVPLLEHARRRALNPIQRLRLLLPVCDALVQAHAQRVAHGDLRPGMLRVDDEGRALLLDWGAGRLLHPATLAADIQGLGGVLQALMPAAPGPDLAFVLQRAQHGTAAQRYGSVEELVADLQRVLHWQPVPGASAPPLHHARLALRRHRVALAGGGIAVLVLAGAAQWGLQRYQAGQGQVERSDAARSFVQQRLQDVEPPPGTPPDPTVLGPRLQQTLEQARAGFDGQPVLRGQVLAELALRFHAMGQPEQARAVAQEALTLVQGNAAAGDPARAVVEEAVRRVAH